MSIEAVAIALHHSQASGTAKLILLGIANHDGDAGSFPKTATLAKYANVHPRRVPEAIAKLVELGEVRVEYKEGGSRTLRAEIAPNLYHMTLVCPPNCDRTSKHTLLAEDGKTALRFGRSYRGAYDGPREKDPEAVERGRKSRETRLQREAGLVDNGPAAAPQESAEPSDGISTSDENSTRSSDENSTSPSDGNSTTKNHPKNHHMNPALVPSVTSVVHNSQDVVEKSAHCEDTNRDAKGHERCQWAGCGCDCHGLRSIVPALPKAKPRDDDATPRHKTSFGLPVPTDEEKSRVSRGAAAARAALRGESP